MQWKDCLCGETHLGGVNCNSERISGETLDCVTVQRRWLPCRSQTHTGSWTHRDGAWTFSWMWQTGPGASRVCHPLWFIYELMIPSVEARKPKSVPLLCTFLHSQSKRAAVEIPPWGWWGSGGFLLTGCGGQNQNPREYQFFLTRESKPRPYLHMNSRQARHFPKASTDPCMDICHVNRCSWRHRLEKENNNQI